MSLERLQSFDPELLLQELRARESHGAGTGARAADDAPPVAKLGRGGGIETVPELEAYATEDIATTLRDAQRVIYGTDDRQDIFELGDPALLTDAASAVALVHDSDITDNGDGTSTLNGPTLGNRRNLCVSEPFREQPSVAFCTGFLVDPSLVATAAHCVEAGTSPRCASCSATRWAIR